MNMNTITDLVYTIFDIESDESLAGSIIAGDFTAKFNYGGRLVAGERQLGADDVLDFVYDRADESEELHIKVVVRLDDGFSFVLDSGENSDVSMLYGCNEIYRAKFTQVHNPVHDIMVAYRAALMMEKAHGRQ